MALFAANPYTSTQLSNVAPLIPSGVSTRPDILPLLEAVLDTCRRDWIYRFLFTTDTSHLTFLTAPLFKHDALTMSTFMHHFEPPSFRTRAYSLTLEGSTVLVPALCVDGYRLGFGVEERRATLTVPGTGKTIAKSARPDQLRYVGDIETGRTILTFLAENEVTIECVSHVATTKRDRMWAKFDRRILNVLGNPFGPVDIQEVLSLLKSCICIREYRHCPGCGARPGTTCFCPSPIDLAPTCGPIPELRILHSHLGAFEGMMHETYFAQGVPLQQRVLVNRVRIEGKLDPELIERLTNWAVRQHLRQVDFGPQASLRSHDSYYDARTEESLTVQVASGGLMYLASCEFTSGNEFSFVQDTTISSNTGLVASNRALLVTNSSGQSSINSAETAIALSNDDTDIVAEIRQLTSEINARQVQSAYGQSFAAARSSLNRDINPTAVEDQKDSRGMTRITQVDGKLEVEKRYGQHEGSQKTARRGRNRRIVVNLDEHDSEEDKRIEAMEAVRMERNRVAARRSNLKRKLRNEARKKELDCLRTLEKDLRSREKELRQENLWLRSLVEKVQGDRQEE